MKRTIAIYTITSSLHAEVAGDIAGEPFIRGLKDALDSLVGAGDNDGCDVVESSGCGDGSDGPDGRDGQVDIEIISDGFDGWGSHWRDLLYVRTGGTEGIFKSLSLPGYVRILTSGASNSLAASMEILSYLRAGGRSGEILHGSAGYIAGRILVDVGDGKDVRAAADVKNGAVTAGAASAVREMPYVDLGGARLGIIGEPSDWLISSGVDYERASRKFNLSFVHIPISKLVRSVQKIAAAETLHGGKQGDVDAFLRGFKGSVAIYDALRKIIAEYSLNALTIRCFDLLDTLHNTGCLALARLNAEGIPSSCEGDVPALVTMVAAKRFSGVCGFQCNLSRVADCPDDAGASELLFAHCTVPLDMVSSFRYDTHFESGIGTAIKGELPAGPVTVFKIAPDLDHMVALHGTLVRNSSEANLCRTQVTVRMSRADASYFLTSPLANHHIIVPGSLYV